MKLLIYVQESLIKHEQYVAMPECNLPGIPVRPAFYGNSADEAIGKLICSKWMDQFFAVHKSAKIEIARRQ